jgi:hypothetical protein
MEEVVMLLTYRILLVVHILGAVASVAVFWAAAVVKKGSRRHTQVGRLFVLSMTVMLTSALGLSAFNLGVPAAVHPLDARAYWLNAIWQTYVAVHLLLSVRFGTRVARTHSTRWNDLGADLPLAAVMLVGGVAVAICGVREGHAFNTAFGLVGTISSGRRLAVLLRPPRSHMGWWYEHMNTLLGIGVPLHATFLLAVGRHLPESAGSWRLALPGIVVLGLPAIRIWIRYYRRRFELQPPRTHAADTSRPVATQAA